MFFRSALIAFLLLAQGFVGAAIAQDQPRCGRCGRIVQVQSTPQRQVKLYPTGQYVTCVKVGEAAWKIIYESPNEAATVARAEELKQAGLKSWSMQKYIPSSSIVFNDGDRIVAIAIAAKGDKVQAVGIGEDNSARAVAVNVN